VYAAIGDQLMQRQPRYLASDRVESGKNYCLGGVIHYYLHPRCSLKSPDIPSFTANDAALDLIRVYMEYGYGVFNCRLCCNTLYGHKHNTLCLLCGSHLSIIKNLIDVRHGVGARFLLQ